MACQSKTGPQGPEGPAGPQGAVGPQGPQGPQGDTGAIGATGATGAEGPQGVQGPPGAVLVVDGGVLIGPSGASVVVTPLTAGDTACATGGVRITQLSDGGITNVCNGAVGAQGIQGVQGLQGVPGPQGAQGVPGTSMTATILTVGSVQCATGGVLLGYPDGGSATVCNGAQGAQGAQGTQGVQGAPGTQGIQGVQGVQGPAGAAGVTATALATMSAQCVTGGVLLTFLDGGTSAVCNGAQGAAGATGAQGIQGVQGAPGVPVTMTALAVGSAQCPTGGALLTQADGGTRAVCNGSTGATGPVGATGPMGATGPTGPPGSVYFVDGGVWNVNPDVITFAGFTAATYNANLGGFPGANQKCDAEYAGSFLCSYGDYSQSEPTVTPGGTGAWIDGERDSYYRRYTGNCTTNSTSWTYGGSSTSYSASYMNSSGGTGSSLCDVLRPIACCRRARTHVFRGFTVATYTADLGGYPGANAKCSTEYPNSFLCTFGDFSRTEPSSGAGGSGAWIDGERDSYGRRYTGNCTTNSTSWTYGGSSTSYSASYMNATGGTGSSLCNVARPLACCSKN